jgi:hypothetical protein
MVLNVYFSVLKRLFIYEILYKEITEPKNINGPNKLSSSKYPKNISEVKGINKELKVIRTIFLFTDDLNFKSLISFNGIVT